MHNLPCRTWLSRNLRRGKRRLPLPEPIPDHSLKATPMALTTQRVDVPVIVDESKCLEKCVACIEVCPLDVLVKNPETGKAYMKYDECWFCLPCEKECPTNAITVQIPFLLR